MTRERSICECNSCGNMSFGTLTVDNITDMFVCKLCSCINAYPFNIYPDEEYNDIMEYMAEKRAAIEFEEFFEA